jgi:hypothetical protein
MMMALPAMVSKAGEYRAKAVECQECAMLAHGAEARRIFEELARRWWRLAERADKLDRDRPAD